MAEPQAFEQMDDAQLVGLWERLTLELAALEAIPLPNRTPDQNRAFLTKQSMLVGVVSAGLARLGAEP